jgi:hypothetical protein
VTSSWLLIYIELCHINFDKLEPSIRGVTAVRSEQAQDCTDFRQETVLHTPVYVLQAVDVCLKLKQSYVEVLKVSFGFGRRR